MQTLQDNEIQVLSLPLSLFVYHPKARTLVGFDHDLRCCPPDGWFPYIHRLYYTNDEIGICIESERTGRQERFVLVHQEMDSNGCIQWLTFQPVNQKCRVKSVTIYNQ